MGEGKTQLIQDQWFLYGNNSFKNHQVGGDNDHQWKQEEEDDHETSSSTSSSFIGENSSSSSSSSSSSTISSLDTTDDASSSSSFNGSLYDLSSLMSQLPIKRGLSKFYNGKSESFTSLSRVASIEDLAKKETPFKRKMKACKSYGAGLDSYKSYTSPKPIITKNKASTKFSFSSSSQSRRGSFTSRSTRPPLIPVQENLGC